MKLVSNQAINIAVIQNKVFNKKVHVWYSIGNEPHLMIWISRTTGEWNNNSTVVVLVIVSKVVTIYIESLYE